MHLTNGSGSGSGSCYFLSLTFKTPTDKTIFCKVFCLLDFEGTFTSFFKDKKSKINHKTVGVKVSLTILA
jgi:hypothetical protein